jgi:hypothetical protein
MARFVYFRLIFIYLSCAHWLIAQENHSVITTPQKQTSNISSLFCTEEIMYELLRYLIHSKKNINETEEQEKNFPSLMEELYSQNLKLNSINKTINDSSTSTEFIISDKKILVSGTLNSNFEIKISDLKDKNPYGCAPSALEKLKHVFTLFNEEQLYATKINEEKISSYQIKYFRNFLQSLNINSADLNKVYNAGNINEDELEKIKSLLMVPDLFTDKLL